MSGLDIIPDANEEEMRPNHPTYFVGEGQNEGDHQWDKIGRWASWCGFNCFSQSVRPS